MLSGNTRRKQMGLHCLLENRLSTEQQLEFEGKDNGKGECGWSVEREQEQEELSWHES